MTHANLTTSGWIIFIAALGLMFSMLAVDIASLKAWSEMTTPTFVGTTIGHLAAVISAFVGGKLIPEQRELTARTRSDDPKEQ